MWKFHNRTTKTNTKVIPQKKEKTPIISEEKPKIKCVIFLKKLLLNITLTTWQSKIYNITVSFICNYFYLSLHNWYCMFQQKKKLSCICVQYILTQTKIRVN